ncbi:PREDICTED: uncharacterized protein LOC107189260 [Dufourea novaeangliae]|uniref:Glycosyltransferase family 92 protein n=1 Tax=Dufourea novaeangliae TaxID=178035 RepID=A0A154PHA5_DUFNO|nr:PREDICTED: uncharacterized protein LOC107189260 [Dufourea novaeangliae]KZC11187.1 hypothetical protein WN55_02601 [Dufourea novaeangliae]
MRNYYQAALAITAVVSLVSLLFYRHEYNKLRYVLEVFNYFGKPNQKNVETNCTNNVSTFSKPNMKFEVPTSSWQRLENDLYVYSAYNIHDTEVQVIGFGLPSSIQDMQCIIFFENEIKPTLGSFKYIPINSNLSGTNTDKSFYSGYYFYCHYTKNKIPVGITFLTKSNININDAPILAIKSDRYNSNYTNVGVCVTPPLIKPMHSSEMIAFINFHDIIGMDNFIVYDFGISNDFNSQLKELSKSQNPQWKFTYTVVPWNFPFSGIHPNIIKDLIQADCLYRTYNKVMYTISLSWEEYVVPRYHHSLVELMTDFKQSKMKADRYKIKSLTFCTQQIDNAHTKNTRFTVFKKTYFESSIIDNRPIYIYNTDEVFKKDNIYIREIGKDLITLNRYKHCFEKPNPNADNEDTSILRFMEDIQDSPMYRKFILNTR